MEDNYEYDEEEEPKLKYERIAADLKKILKKDGASSIYVHDKVLLVGTNRGWIHVMDHQGNQILHFHYHSSPVTMINMDLNGSFLASCANDKKIIIQELYSLEPYYKISLDIPVRCVALEPNFGKSKSKQRFLVGTSALMLYEKALFGAYKPTVLFECPHNSGEVIRDMKWGEKFMVFAVDSAITVMDMESRTIVSLIKRSHSLALGCDQYPPHICWQDKLSFIIGWGDSIKVCRIKERKLSTKPSDVELPPFCVEIIYMFSTDFYICGIGPLDSLVVVLAYTKSSSVFGQSEENSPQNNEWRRPQMRVLHPHQKTYEELSKDVLDIKNYKEYQPFHYRLEHLSEERRFYICCPQDVVVAKQSEPKDRINWLRDHDRYEEALEVVESCGGKVAEHTILNVGQEFIEHLFEQMNFTKAAEVVPKVAGDNRILWELFVDRFHTAGHVKELSFLLPTGSPGAILSKTVYQTVLLDLLNKDHQTYLDLVKVWPKNLYNVSLAINDVLEVLAKNSQNKILLRALAHLYSNIDKHDKALAIYLKLKHTDVFCLIRRHCLYFCVSKHIVELMSLDADATLKMCSEQIPLIQPSVVVNKLNQNQDLLYKYLDMLFEEKPQASIDFHNILIPLYADRNKQKLMPLLMTSSKMDLERALEVVQWHCLVPETVYLLTLMGSSEKALRIVLEEQNDLDWAIKICQQHSEDALWNVLVEHCIDKPDYIRVLLNNMGSYVNPLVILKKIPENLEIPGLRKALTKILHDYQLKIALQSGYQKILTGDCIKLLEKQVNTQSLGLAVHSSSECCLCQQCVVEPGIRENDDNDLVVFGCRHVYHSKCLMIQQPEFEMCVVCRSNTIVIPTSNG